ncbi:RNA-guided endonuclease InsQ/TnpB family protein [Tepidibacter thalassicus]|uniref:Transposase, IS605 OrfB family, central region n=1 Tax=Tepidibacter thalassicus DSM 15285 TaxID=1123350 RepID=A0A1M5R195_9FIRM|nr:RNA-guided endonuclease TnpB family protein [Tepidibacter thalassicus]SHH19810.1 transposase, IS605 OrfB family, central region [Tepidibacter thalassicus DSM 15285]
MIVRRVEKHIIRQNNKYYDMLDNFCFMSKNLYNFANYQIRQQFCKNGEFINYTKLDKLLKQDGMDYDYRNMPVAQSAQQCLRLLEKNWKSFFESIKKWNKNKDKYTGRPKLPKYLKKNGRNILILTNNNCKIKDGIIKFPKSFNGFTLKTKVNKLQQVRILPRNKHFIIEVVYRIDIKEPKVDNRGYIGIDIGIDNLATICNNVGAKPIIVDGKSLKSINQYYNKKLSHFKKVAKRMNGIDLTNRMNRLTIKRNNKVIDYLHKASKMVIDYTLSLNCNTIVIGTNKDWKRESKLSKKVNQSFVGIPHQRFIEMIQYKAENVGINVILTEESYTSGTSFLDNELPIKENYNKRRRIKRGLFKSNKGILINADLNGAYQIVKKVFPKAFAEGIEGVGLHPVRVDV